MSFQSFLCGFASTRKTPSGLKLRGIRAHQRRAKGQKACVASALCSTVLANLLPLDFQGKERGKGRKLGF
jgi:hypothetical protein